MYIKKSEGYLFGMALSNEVTQQLNTSLKYKVLTQAKLNSLNRKFSPLLCILALSEGLSRKIRIFYPKTENLDEYACIMEQLYLQRQDQEKFLYI